MGRRAHNSLHRHPARHRRQRARHDQRHSRFARSRALRQASRPSRPAHPLGGQCRRIRALCRRCGRALSRSLCRCRGAARRRMDRHACRVSFHLRQRRAHAGRPRAADADRRLCRAKATRWCCSKTSTRSRTTAEVHYLAHTVEEWRYYFDAIQSPARSGCRSPSTTRTSCRKGSPALSRRSTSRGRGGAARRLLSQRPRGAPAAGRGRSRFRRHVPPHRGRRVPRPLHERVRLARR